MILLNHTPAEVILLRDGTKAPLHALLKYTFVDLLVKQVLELRTVIEQPSEHDPERTLKYACEGKNFPTYTPQAHEHIFLEVFEKSPGIQIILKGMVKIARDNAVTAQRYRKVVMRCPRLADFFEITFMHMFVGGFRHTLDGHAQRAVLANEIQDLEATLPDILKTDKQKAVEILRALGGNIFLLSGIELALLKELDTAFEQAAPVLYDDHPDMTTTTDMTYYHFDDGGHSHHHGHASHDNDTTSDWGCSGGSGCSSDSNTSGDSSCSSDSGCSSGCGGCGGGGGD